MEKEKKIYCGKMSQFSKNDLLTKFDVGNVKTIYR